MQRDTFIEKTFIRSILVFRYLQEIGYTDTIIDVRSNRVRSLLGLNNNTDTEEINTPALNGNEGVSQDKREYSKDKNEYNNEMRRGKQHTPKKVGIKWEYMELITDI